MRLHFTEEVEEYAHAVSAFLEAAPAERNVLRTVLEQLRQGTRYSDSISLWWVVDGERTVGAAQWTPPFPLLLSDMPEAACCQVADAVRPRSDAIGTACEAVNAPREAAEAVSAALTAQGYRVTVRQSLLLQVCTEVRDVPVPPGRRRIAGARDTPLLAKWLVAFGSEARTSTPRDAERWIADLVAARHAFVWDIDGEVVSFAGDREPFGGVVRIGPVYTPAEQRNHGYARRLVQELTEAALRRDG